jgi:hypothetical protein
MTRKWRRLARIVKLKSRWITVYADKMLDHENNVLEYWHFDRADSVIIIPVQNNNILLPEPIYRVGIGKVMLDFPGGRIENNNLRLTIQAILRKELGLTPKLIDSMHQLNDKSYAVDSSFSSQELYIFIVHIKSDNQPIKSCLHFPASNTDKLLKKLECGQCRLALHEFRTKLKIA